MLDTNLSMSTNYIILIFGIVLALILGYVLGRKQRPFYGIIQQTLEQLIDGDYNLKFPLLLPKEERKIANCLSELSQHLNLKFQDMQSKLQNKEALLETIPDGVITVDAKGVITTINKAATVFFTELDTNAQNKKLSHILRHSVVVDVLDRVLSKDGFVQEEMTSSTEKNLQLLALRLLSKKGETKGAILVFNDVTHLKKLENMRQNFVANVSHELKTPITLIKGFIETLAGGAHKNEDERMEFLGIIEKHANRLEAIIEDLLSLSRIEEGKKHSTIEYKLTSIQELVLKSMSNCSEKAETKRIKLHYKKTDNDSLKINPSLMEQALTNLIDNAIKYSSENSMVTISTGTKENEYYFEIKDEGSGIGKDHLNQLFERFYRVDKARSRDVGGTGLGLAIVKHIAQAHNGYVTVSSKEGIGSTFTIFFPKKV